MGNKREQVVVGIPTEGNSWPTNGHWEKFDCKLGNLENSLRLFSKWEKDKNRKIISRILGKSEPAEGEAGAPASAGAQRTDIPPGDSEISHRDGG